MTGYSREEVIGRNCRFLQGPRTDRATVDGIKDSCARGSSITVKLLNYRKDKSVFWNLLHISPVHDQDGRLQRFIGCQMDITSDMEPNAPDTASGVVSSGAELREVCPPPPLPPSL